MVRWSALAVASMAVGCDLFTEPDAGLDGNYPLVGFGADALPAKIFELPTRDGQPTACWYSLTEGSLQLDTRVGQQFEYTLMYRDSCDGQLLSTTNVSGTFTIANNDLVFVTSGGGGSLVTFPGRVRSDTVVVDRSLGFTYYFKKAK